MTEIIKSAYIIYMSCHVGIDLLNYYVLLLRGYDVKLSEWLELCHVRSLDSENQTEASFSLAVFKSLTSTFYMDPNS